MALLAVAAGCGTIAGRHYPSLRSEPPTSYYPATAVDAYFVVMGTASLFSSPSDRDGGHIPPPAWGVMMIPFGILDLPISLITDTILLPLDLVRVPAERDRQSRTFRMDIGVKTTNAPALILLDTSVTRWYKSHHKESMEPLWATFRCVASGEIIKVNHGDKPFGCVGTAETYEVVLFGENYVEMEKLKK